MAKEKQTVKKLAELRKAKGFTQRELAYICGLSVDAITQYERGLRHPNGKALSKLARALGCTMDDLYDGDTDAPLNALCEPKRA